MTIAVEFKPGGVYDYTKVEWKREGIELSPSGQFPEAAEPARTK